MSNVYRPREDTLLLMDEILKLSDQRVLELGVGSGLITLTLAKFNEHTVGTEIDSFTVRQAWNLIVENGYGGKVDLVVCDGADPFRSEIFDTVVFNPPYLPTDLGVDQTVDGGKDGIIISEKWFEHAARVAKQAGDIIFLTSTLSDYQGLLKKAASLGFQTHIVKHQHLFFEDLLVVKALRKHH